MNVLVLSASYAMGDSPASRLVAEESAVLIMLAATLLVYRTFRERYLLVWIVGWLAYFASQWTLRSSEFATSQITAVSHAEFLIAVCLFAASVFTYTHSKKLVPPLLAGGVVLAAFAVVRALFFPDPFPARLGLEVAYRIITVTAAVQLIRSRWGRREFVPWVLSLSLLSLHLEWAPITNRLPTGFGLMADMVLGLSMLLLVFDDSKTRTRRLGVINALTTSIMRAQQHGPMMATALEELKNLVDAKAAWLRVVEGDKMVVAHQIGLSSDFMRDRTVVPYDEKFVQTLSDTAPTVLKTKKAGSEVRDHLSKEGFHHCVLVPVRGKKSVIGTLTLGSTRRISYTPDDKEFLYTSAHQLGLAVENLLLLDQVMRSHRQWTNTFDSIPDAVLLHDGEFRVMKANRALFQQLQRAPVDVIDQPCEQVLPREHGKWTGCPYCGDSAEGFHEGPDPCFGGFSMVSTSSYTDQVSKQKGTIHVIRDVTDRRIAEEKYRLLFEQMQEGVFVATPEGILIDCNDALVRMLGHASRADVIGLNLETDLYASPEQRKLFREEVELHNFVRNFEVLLRKKDGSLLSAMESSFATRGTSGKIARYQGFLLDITEKKRAEDEIRRRNRELNALNAMAVIATQTFDLDEILNLTLRQVLSLLSAETGSIYLCEGQENTFRRRADWGQRLGDRHRLAEVSFPSGFGDLVTRSRTEVITPEFLPHLPPLVSEFIRADGLASWIWVLLWGKERPVGMMGISRAESREYTTNDENLLVAIGRQLATTMEKVRLYEETCRAYEDLRHTQEQLLQSEKMSAVGQLISGVAHELNNPLTAILGYAQLLEGEGLGARAADFVSKLFKQAQRTHRVVQNLLSFARQRKPLKQAVDICKVLDETLALRDYDLRHHRVHLVREVESNLPAVTADPHQLEQVCLNIINNAVDAMLETTQGGTLKVRVFLRDNFVHAEFQDTGPGIKEPNRIFEPFYTTKSVGKGTGLGLSICYGIIKEHGGDISARNCNEGGAAITVRLPSAGWNATLESGPAVSRRETAIEGHILLVEDEEAVLEFEREVLRGAGAEVVAVKSEQEAKEQMRRQPFDTLVMSGKMADGWSAPEAYRWLAESNPGMERHVLFTFSTVAEPEIRAFLQENNVPCLVKPFEVADLISQARRLLQKKRAAVAG